MGWNRSRWKVQAGAATACLLFAVNTLVFAALPAGAALPTLPTPPAEPAPGELGGVGPCGYDYEVRDNPRAWLGEQVWLIEPTGKAAAPTGGNCDDPKRPTIFFAHGYLLMNPLFYEDLLYHWVSNGWVVVYANYNPIPLFSLQYDMVDTGFRSAAQWWDRIDTSDVGFGGHSFGGGMTPWLVQQAAQRGWGSNALWFTTLAQAFSLSIGSGPIAVPDHARALIIGFEGDFLVDNRLGMEVYESLELPDDQKEYLEVFSEFRALSLAYASHLSPMTIFGSSDSIREYGIYRPLDALAACARTGEHCDTDITWMGEWTDGVEARRSVATDDPVDFGSPALVECTLFLNPRPCPS